MKKTIILSMIASMSLWADISSDKKDLADARKLIDNQSFVSLQKMQSLHTQGNTIATYMLGSCNIAGYFTPRCSDEESRGYESSIDKQDIFKRVEALAQNGDGNGAFTLARIYDNGIITPKDQVKAVEWYRKGADLGNANAMVNLGVMYGDGTGVAKDQVKAVEWYLKGADLGNANAMFYLGLMYANGTGVAKDEAKAVEWFRKAAELGNTNAMVNIGVMYEYGKGVAKDEAKAVEWYRKGADLGNANAMKNLGVMYENGTGVAKDQAKAVEWYRKGAELGNAQAMNNLGVMYKYGTGVAKDEAKAVEWFRKAAELGNAQAMANLGIMYSNGKGVDKDQAKAVEWYRKGAELGNAHAMANLGVMYDNGTGVAKDEAKAVEWYRKGAELGNTDAMNNLGLMYDNGTGVAKDNAKAVEWYRKGADLGNTNAMVNLGWMYSKGTGVAKDQAKAVEWYRKGAELGGNAQAMYNLGVMYRDGTGVAKDQAKAAEWYKKSADLGNTDAMVNLGIMYKNGGGITKDYDKAMEWFQKAAALGDGSAMANIGGLYKNGYGVSKDYDKALEWLHKAIKADESYSWSYRAIAEIYDHLDDDDKYQEWNLKAAEKGSGVAMAILGERELGKYSSNKYNPNKAAEWFVKALKTDDSAIFTDNGEDGRERAKRYLDELKASGKITDPAVLKQVNAIFDPAPNLKWITIPQKITTQSIDISVEAIDQGGGVGNVQLFIDDTPITIADTRSLKRSEPKGIRHFNVNLPSGKHTIKVRAFAAENQGNYNDIETTVSSTYGVIQKPKLHIVAIGINEYQESSFNLKSAVADASAVYQKLLNQTSQEGIYDQGETYLLTTLNQTSKKSIMATMEKIRASAKTQDVFVFYVAAHGKALDEGYYMTTSDLSSAKEKDIRAQSLSEKELTQMLMGIGSAKKFTILDTCNAGAALKAESIMSRSLPRDAQDAVEVMNAKTGVTILMSSQKSQVAVDEYKGHGLFTYVLLEAMNGKSSRDGKSVYSDDIMSHVEREVPRIAKSEFHTEQSVYASKGGQGFPLVMVGK